jgi:hypothetical protein
MNPHLDAIIQPEKRLSVVALLAVVDRAEVGFVRDTVGVSETVLWEDGRALAEAGYVDIEKGRVGKRPRIWFRLTPAGRHAFDAHVEALREIVAQAGATVPDGT